MSGFVATASGSEGADSGIDGSVPDRSTLSDAVHYASIGHCPTNRVPICTVEAPHQDPNRAALGRDCRDAVLGGVGKGSVGGANGKPAEGLLASGQITMRKVDGWQSLGEPLAAPVPVDLAA